MLRDTIVVFELLNTIKILNRMPRVKDVAIMYVQP